MGVWPSHWPTYRLSSSQGFCEAEADTEPRLQQLGTWALSRMPPQGLFPGEGEGQLPEEVAVPLLGSGSGV